MVFYFWGAVEARGIIFRHTGETFPSNFIHNSPVTKVSTITFALVYCKVLTAYVQKKWSPKQKITMTSIANLLCHHIHISPVVRHFLGQQEKVSQIILQHALLPWIDQLVKWTILHEHNQQKIHMTKYRTYTIILYLPLMNWRVNNFAIQQSS